MGPPKPLAGCAIKGRGAMSAWLEHKSLGYNYRLDEMSAAPLAALNCAVLRPFLHDGIGFPDVRERLSDFGWLSTPKPEDRVRMSWFVYVVTLMEGMDRDQVMAAMEAQGIPVRGYFSPIHRQPYILERFPENRWYLPITENIATRTLALPFHNHLSEAEVDRVARALNACSQRAAA